MRTFQDLRAYKMSREERDKVEAWLAKTPPRASVPHERLEQLVIPADAYVQIGKPDAKPKRKRTPPAPRGGA